MTWLPFALVWLNVGAAVGWWAHHRLCEHRDEAPAWRLRGEWYVVRGGGSVRRVPALYDWSEGGEGA